jgi:hypothetical protein
LDFLPVYRRRVKKGGRGNAPGTGFTINLLAAWQLETLTILASRWWRGGTFNDSKTVFLFYGNPVPSTDAGRPLQIARAKELEDVKENIVVGFCPAHDFFFLKLLEGSLVRIALSSELHCRSAKRGK